MLIYAIFDLFAPPVVSHRQVHHNPQQRCDRYKPINPEPSLWYEFSNQSNIITAIFMTDATGSIARTYFTRVYIPTIGISARLKMIRRSTHTSVWQPTVSASVIQFQTPSRMIRLAE